MSLSHVLRGRRRFFGCPGLVAGLLITTLAGADPASAEPAISCSPFSLGFTGLVYSTISPQNLVVSNAGDGTLNYTINSDIFWLSVTNAAGSLAAGASREHAVQVNTRGRESRRYLGDLTVDDAGATNSPQTVPVSLVLTSPAPPTAASAWGVDVWDQALLQLGLSNAVAVSEGPAHSLVLRTDRTVVARGYNVHGETDIPPELTNAIAVAAGDYHSVVLRSDGTVLNWGDNAFGQTNMPPGLVGVLAVSAGSFHSLALRGDNTVTAWGNNYYGQTNVPTDLTNAVAVAGGYFHSLALRADGTVTAWGFGDYEQTNVPPGLTGAVAVAGGFYHSLALRSVGTVIAWGYSPIGQTNVPAGLSNVVAVAAGQHYSLALRSGGTVIAWGQCNHGQTNVPPGLTNVFAISAGQNRSLALGPGMPLEVTAPLGSPSPVTGTTWHVRGIELACSGNSPIWADATQYVCSGWTGTGSAPENGSSGTVTFAMDTSSTLNWIWSTNYLLSASANNGTLDVPASQWIARDSNALVTATPWTYYQFGRWSGDTNDAAIAGNAVTLPMTRPRTVTAWCDALLATNGVPQWWLASWGLTNLGWDAEAMDDPDRDRRLTWEEYFADTEPTNADSVLAFTSLEMEPGGVRVHWQGGGAAWQYLEARGDLLSTGEQWLAVFTNTPPTLSNVDTLVPTNDSQRLYFRIRTQR